MLFVSDILLELHSRLFNLRLKRTQLFRIRTVKTRHGKKMQELEGGEKQSLAENSGNHGIS